MLWEHKERHKYTRKQFEKRENSESENNRFNFYVESEEDDLRNLRKNVLAGSDIS